MTETKCNRREWESVISYESAKEARSKTT